MALNSIPSYMSFPDASGPASYHNGWVRDAQDGRPEVRGYAHHRIEMNSALNFYILAISSPSSCIAGVMAIRVHTCLCFRQRRETTYYL